MSSDSSKSFLNIFRIIKKMVQNDTNFCTQVIVCLLIFIYTVSASCKKSDDDPIPEVQDTDSVYVETDAEPISSKNIFYVGKNGNDSNPGTKEKPWLTIQKAANTLNAGQKVYVCSGVYKERVTVTKSGVVDNYIIFSACPGNKVIIDGTGIASVNSSYPTSSGLFYINGADYIKVKGFKLKNAKTAGFYATQADCLIIKDNYINNTYSSGIGVWQSNNIVIDGNELVLSSNAGAGANTQECLSIAGCDGFEVKNNHVHHSGTCNGGGEGLDAKHSNNGTIHHNVVHDIKKLGIYVDAWDIHSSNIEVYSNIVYHCIYYGMACAAEDGGTLENVKFYNNVCHNNGATGLVVAGKPDWGIEGKDHFLKKIYIYNNTFYKNRYLGQNWGSGIEVWANQGEDIFICNNLSYKDYENAVVVNDTYGLPTNIVVENNLLGIDPLFVDPDNTDLSKCDFHIKNGSPTINKAVGSYVPSTDFDGKARSDGNVDIGAFEYGAN